MLTALDHELTQDTELHCMGGFVLAEHYRLVRATGDIDVLESAGTHKATIARLAGRGSPLHRRHRVYIDIVTVADVPDDYDSRLVAMDIEGLARLRLKVFERHDLVLAKLCRNIDRDREDVVALARGPGLDIDVLRQRYLEELRPKLGRPAREDLTLRLWIEIIEELRGGS
jgi:hypothetical protein